MNREQFLSSARALIDLDAKGALVPHGIGGHARELLEDAIRLLSTPPTEAGVEGLDAHRPLSLPLRESSTDPAWVQLLKLFARHNQPEPPILLRDELVSFMAWAWYGLKADAALTIERERSARLREALEHAAENLDSAGYCASADLARKAIQQNEEATDGRD